MADLIKGKPLQRAILRQLKQGEESTGNLSALCEAWFRDTEDALAALQLAGRITYRLTLTNTFWRLT